MTTDIHWTEIRRIVALLAEERYDEVAWLCRGSRLSAEDIKGAVVSYGGTIIPLPSEARALIDSCPIQRATPSAWSVVVPLFTREEGRSDLSLELTISEPQPGTVAVQMDNLHVL